MGVTSKDVRQNRPQISRSSQDLPKSFKILETYFLQIPDFSKQKSLPVPSTSRLRRRPNRRASNFEPQMTCLQWHLANCQLFSLCWCDKNMLFDAIWLAKSHDQTDQSPRSFLILCSGCLLPQWRFSAVLRCENSQSLCGYGPNPSQSHGLLDSDILRPMVDAG